MAHVRSSRGFARPTSDSVTFISARAAAVALAVCVLPAAGCSSRSSVDVADEVQSGAISFALTVEGLSVEAIGIRLEGSALPTPRVRSLDVSDPSATISFAEHGLPPGSYDLTLTASAVDDPSTPVNEGDAECVGSAFGIVVESGKVTEVNDLVLVCTLDGGELQQSGAIEVRATAEVVVAPTCTDLASKVFVGPLQAVVGESVSIEAVPVAGVSVSWSANGGTIAADGSSFTCPDVAGQVKLRADFVRDEDCTQSFEEVVSCVRAPELRLGEAAPQIASVTAESVNALYGVVFDAAGNFYTVGPYSDAVGADQQTAVTKFSAAGVIDTAFGTSGVAKVNIGANANEAFRAIGLQQVGAATYLVVAGTTQFDSGGVAPANLEQDTAVARFTLDGVLDTSFGTNGVVRVNLNTGVPNSAGTSWTGNESIWDLLVTPEGKLVLHGTQRNAAQDGTSTPLTDADYVLLRLNADGSIDNDFSGDGKVTLDLGRAGAGARTATLLPDGSVVGVGYTSGAPGVTTQSPVLYKVTPSGEFDATFATHDVWSAPGVWHDQAVPAPLRAEAYAATAQGANFVTMGYGPGPSGTTGSDFVSFRFTAAGDIDRTYGTFNGAVYVDGELRGDNGRARVVVLPDNQVVGAGGGGRVPPPQGGSNTDGMIVLLSEGGVPVEGFGAGGRRLYELGGANDFLHAAVLSPDASQVVFVGQSGTGSALKGVVLRLPVLPVE